ncbi:hypothetical protein Pst134EB_025288 [Puccinia striiformis f. sp. tritici]|uniref:Uncharacterized protein n=1 Tax=Puccinia striiformis f. sp. tritici PST-78 TaxID=1165861 RepID=A0A0L0US92_9BASI|nr:hypothetical protein Pst134EB_025288 [Puccinia striiformis f. sp. tritici]KNE89599.1 hypothetical protein PSTG_16937 [Puccinia striiformis f. sp. tritici PST-78]
MVCRSELGGRTTPQNTNEFKKQMRMTRPGHLSRDQAVDCPRAALTGDETFAIRNNNEDPCRVSRLEQFSCRPDTIRGSIQNPKWICAPIHRFFKLCPSESSHPSRLISTEIPASAIETDVKHGPTQANKNQGSHRLSADS